MKKLLFLLLTLLFISCSGTGGGYEFCLVSIKYHKSSNCDDKIEYFFISDYSGAKAIITETEGILSEAEIGECVLVNLGQIQQGNNIIRSVYIVNDSDKSWLSINRYCN